jgi:hypothetical protein
LSRSVASVTAYGEVEVLKEGLKNGAKENDLICVSEIWLLLRRVAPFEREKKSFSSESAIAT